MYMYKSLLQYLCVQNDIVYNLHHLPLHSGNRTYIGYVYMEYTQNNSVLLAFVEVLKTAVKRRAASDTLDDNEEPSGMEQSVLSHV